MDLDEQITRLRSQFVAALFFTLMFLGDRLDSLYFYDINHLPGWHMNIVTIFRLSMIGCGLFVGMQMGNLLLKINVPR